jgi:hypothetical protein
MLGMLSWTRAPLSSESHALRQRKKTSYDSEVMRKEELSLDPSRAEGRAMTTTLVAFTARLKTKTRECKRVALDIMNRFKGRGKSLAAVMVVRGSARHLEVINERCILNTRLFEVRA